MERPNGYNGEDIIGQIYKARQNLKMAKRGIGNAEFRITNDGSNIDKMWIRIKEEEEKKFEESQKQFVDLFTQLKSLKYQHTKEEYESLLQKVGIVIGMTEDINHVEDSMYDEHDLQKALDETSDMIQKRREETALAKENLDEDMVTILTSEISYYERDMRKHHWGVSRLEKLNSESTKTR